MFTFKPRRLQRTARQVEKDHPERIADYHSPRFASSHLGKQLAKRLLATEKDEMEEFLHGLTALERSLYCGLIHHEQQRIQRRVLYGLTLDATLGDVRHLWTYLEQIFGAPQTEMTARIIVELPESSEQLEPSQRELCQGVLDDDDALGKFWMTLQRQDRVADEFTNPSSFTAGTSLGAALAEYFFAHGWQRLWLSTPPDAFRDVLTELSRATIIDAMIQGWKIHKQHQTQSGAHWLKTFLELLGVPGSRLWNLLQERHREAARWYRSLFVRRELHQFFEKFPDNERFEFWKQFIPDLYDARGDLLNQRLFLDFGTFGIIEFAEIGNAAYVYGAEDFRQIRDMNFRIRPTHHSELKDRTRSLIPPLTHRGQWQPRFRRTINNYLRQTNRK